MSNHVYEPVGQLFFCKNIGDGILLSRGKISEVNYCPLCGAYCKGDIKTDNAVQKVMELRNCLDAKLN